MCDTIIRTGGSKNQEKWGRRLWMIPFLHLDTGSKNQEKWGRRLWMIPFLHLDTCLKLLFSFRNKLFRNHPDPCPCVAGVGKFFIPCAVKKKLGHTFEKPRTEKGTFFMKHMFVYANIYMMKNLLHLQ